MNVVHAGIKEDDLCITKEVIFSALCKTKGHLDSRILHTQLQRHHVDEYDIFLLKQLRAAPFLRVEMYNVLRTLNNVNETLKIFYLCLRETQDVCREHQMIANDLKWEARSEFTIVHRLKLGLTEVGIPVGSTPWKSVYKFVNTKYRPDPLPFYWGVAIICHTKCCMLHWNSFVSIL